MGRHHLNMLEEGDSSELAEYSLLLEHPTHDPPPRVHPAYPREQRHRIEYDPSLLQSPSQISVPFGGQRYESLTTAALRLPSNATLQPQLEFQNPFIGLSETSPLNPNGRCFNARDWLSNLAGYMSKDPRRYPQRTAGFSFRDLKVHGLGSCVDYQKDVGNVVQDIGAWFTRKQRKTLILHGLDGFVDRGEMLLVLGRPGSGCSTFLKTIAGQVDGLVINPDSRISYQGIPATRMHKQFRGEAVYLSENNVYLPHLTVEQTLHFAAKARAPRDCTFPGVTREMYAKHMTDVAMATLGIVHVAKSMVGSENEKSLRNGERSKVGICEAMLCGAPLQCWDNSTRGLDSESVMNFLRYLRDQTRLTKSTACIALYQASQEAYDMFEKVTILYEGRQIYFGPCHEAKSYFTNLGFIEKTKSQTTAEFLTSLTNADLRVTKPGYEFRTPKTPIEFEMVWKTSLEYTNLLREIGDYDRRYPPGGEAVTGFLASRRSQQARYQSCQSPYTISTRQQITLCLHRAYQRSKSNATFALSTLLSSMIMASIVGSIFYNLSDSTGSFHSRSMLIFFSLVLNAFGSAMEILQRFVERPVIEKHARYALYHPFAEAVAGLIVELPFRMLKSALPSVILYLMANLRRTISAFSIFLSFSFVTTAAISALLRTIGVLSRSNQRALFPCASILLALIVYAGFMIPPGDFKPWFGWIWYINPFAWAFESLMINEFYGRNFPCSKWIPEFKGTDSPNQVCATIGATAGSTLVSGTEYIRLIYGYTDSIWWSNLLAIVTFCTFFLLTYLAMTELITVDRSRGEVLCFRRKHQVPVLKRRKYLETYGYSTESTAQYSSELTSAIQKQTSIFQWKNICLDIKTKYGYRRILEHIDGWVKPGTITMVLGASGAGKTSLLDVLANRNTNGFVSGEALVDGSKRDISFQRKIGYVQQYDLHLESCTVRESLQFSAVLRQPATVIRQEKLAYVEEIIRLLDMEQYADAVVGVPGEGMSKYTNFNVPSLRETGLNIEQRKKLTLAVELAAKPQLPLLLDEPTSGMDSDTAWNILNVLEKLALHGQAIVCTFHQPSATIFHRFDRLLLLTPQGRAAYFGELGRNCVTVIRYFERNGARPFSPGENIAEWLMETVGPHDYSCVDWPEVWRKSSEYKWIHRELDDMENYLRRSSKAPNSKKFQKTEFASSPSTQFRAVFTRVNAHYWRTPSYIYSKAALSLFYGFFLGFSCFQAGQSVQDMQNQTLCVFLLLTFALSFVPQLLSSFVIQRAVFEKRELLSKFCSWKVFILSIMLVELLYNTLMAVIIFASWYFPIFQTRVDAFERAGLMFLLIWIYLVFASTFGHVIQSALESEEMAGGLASVLLLISMMFCGIMVEPTALPKFWTFMYRCSPFTYLVGPMLSTGLSGSPITCSDIELLHFEPFAGNTCQSYMSTYMETAGGYLISPYARSNCSFCPIKSANDFLTSLSISRSNRWWHFGLVWVFILFNVVLALVLYRTFRVPQVGNKHPAPILTEVVHDAALENTAKLVSLRDEQGKPEDEDDGEMIPLDVF